MANMKLVVSDLSNIEGRILAYLAGEEWKLAAFREYDAGTGPDLYNITACSIIGGDPWNVPKKDRNVFGKVPDLAGGFQGGSGAYDTFEKSFGINLLDYWDVIEANANPSLIQKARDNWAKWGEAAAGDTPKPLWIAREVCKLAWRARHPATVALWYSVQDAIAAAMRRPGSVHRAGPKMLVDYVTHVSGDWLRVLLPSGKYLTYHTPRISATGDITYMGYATENNAGGAKVWTRLYTYGGKVVENACQALAGDVLKYTMPAVEAAGYEMVLSVHDEDVTQAPDDPRFTSDALSRIISTPPPWAPDLPLSAAGFEGDRYKKED